MMHDGNLKLTLSLCFSIIVRDQASHPHKTIDKITVLLILIFVFLDCSLINKKILYRMLLSIS